MTADFGGMIGGSFSLLGRNFGKVLLILGAYIAIIAVPYMLWLSEASMDVASGVEGDMIDPFYMFFYVMVAMLPVLIREFIVFALVVAFLGPIFMGAAGRVLYCDAQRDYISLGQAFSFGLSNYKYYFVANLLYALCVLGAVFGGVGALYCVTQMSHDVVETWFYPCAWLVIGGNVFLLYCLSFIPAIGAEGKMSGIKIFTASFKTALDRDFLKKLGVAAIGAAISCVIVIACVFAEKNFINSGVDMLGILPFDETQNIYSVIMFVGFALSGVVLYAFVSGIYDGSHKQNFGDGKGRISKKKTTRAPQKITARRVYPPDVRRRIG